MAVAWQSAIKLRWHVVLLITANDTLPLWVTNVHITCRIRSPLPLSFHDALNQHLFFTMCSSSNMRATISPTQFSHSACANISQFLSCQLFFFKSCDLWMIWIKVNGCFAEVKCPVSERYHLVWLNYFWSRLFVLLSHKFETSRNGAQESSWGFFLSKRKCILIT